MKGILILFVDPAADGGGASYARDNEKFYNPKIKKVSVTIDGVSSLYNNGMLPHQHFEEIQKHFAEGKHRTTPDVFKEGEQADVELDEFLTTKYGFVFGWTCIALGNLRFTDREED